MFFIMKTNLGMRRSGARAVGNNDLIFNGEKGLHDIFSIKENTNHFLTTF